MKVENEKFTFDTGKVITANNGLIGLSESMNEISQGYDGHIWQKELVEYYKEYEIEDALTQEELIELAKYMADLWKRFKVRLTVEKLRGLR